MFKRISLIMLLLMLATGVQAQDDPQDIRFFLTFVPNIQFSPAYVMIEKGYAAEADLNVVIEHGDENVGVDLIAAGEIPFGIISGEQVILARGGGRPVVFVYEWFQEYPVAVVVPDTTEGIETIADLAGRKVGLPGRFGANYSGLTAVLGAHDMTESDLNLEEIGFAASDVICVGGVEAAVVYINNEPLQIQQRADAGNCGNITHVDVFPVSDYVDMVSNGIVTNEETIEEDPELVQAFVTAFDKGLRDAIHNPAEAYLISLEYVENLPISDTFRAALEEAAAAQEEFLATEPDSVAIAESRDSLWEALSADFEPELTIQFQVLLETTKLWDAEQLGYTDPESWEVTEDVLEVMNMLVGEVDLNSAYTNDFLLESE